MLTVPDDGLALGELLDDHLGRLGAVVETHPAVLDVLDLGDLGVGISGELVGEHNVGREDELDALVLGLGLCANQGSANVR